MVGKRNIQLQEGAKQQIGAGLHLPYTTEVSTRGKGSKDRVNSVRFTFIPARLKDLPKRRGVALDWSLAAHHAPLLEAARECQGGSDAHPGLPPALFGGGIREGDQTALRR